jgi:hypothetical protein
MSVISSTHLPLSCWRVLLFEVVASTSGAAKGLYSPITLKLMSPSLGRDEGGEPNRLGGGGWTLSGTFGRCWSDGRVVGGKREGQGASVIPTIRLYWHPHWDP